MKLNWIKSENGNLTLEANGCKMTAVYDRKAGGYHLPGGLFTRDEDHAAHICRCMVTDQLKAQASDETDPITILRIERETKYHFVDPNKWAAQQPMNLMARIKSKAA